MRYKTSFRKHRSVRKRRTKQKRKRGGITTDVDIYKRDLTRLESVSGSTEIVEACNQIQSSLGPKYTSFGCSAKGGWILPKKINTCRQEKLDVLNAILNRLQELHDENIVYADVDVDGKEVKTVISDTITAVLVKYNTTNAMLPKQPMVDEEQPPNDDDDESRQSKSFYG
jgi:hypothetical protein